MTGNRGRLETGIVNQKGRPVEAALFELAPNSELTLSTALLPADLWRFFWINGAGSYTIPRDADYVNRAGNQKTFIVPSHDLVVVRLDIII